MGILFGGQVCREPNEIYEACLRMELPVDWYGKPNSYLTVVGPNPGRGWLLMMAADLYQLYQWDGNRVPQQEPLYDLTFTDINNGNTTWKKLLLVNAECLVPGGPGDPNTCYLVEVRDCRHLACNDTFAPLITAQYNVRAPAGAPNAGFTDQSFYEDSLNSGNTWTWQALLDDIWNNWVKVSELGTSPQIDADLVPASAPINLRFDGVAAWLAYNAILERLGLALFPAFDGTFGIVAIGNLDQSLADAQTDWRYSLAFDKYWIESRRAKVPKSVYTLFHGQSMAYGTEPTTTTAANQQWTTNKAVVTYLNNDTENTPNTETDSNAFLFDDTSALINFDGTVYNDAGLLIRSAERAGDYYRMVNQGGKRLDQTYNGFIPDARFLPGGQVTGTAYYDRGLKPFTQIVHVPYTQRKLYVGDDARFKVPEMGEKVIQQLDRPDFGRPTFPVYPPQVQSVIVDATSDHLGLYHGHVNRTDPVNFVDNLAEECWLLDPNLTGLATATAYLAKINGTTSATKTGDGAPKTLPLYICQDAGNALTVDNNTGDDLYGDNYAAPLSISPATELRILPDTLALINSSPVPGVPIIGANLSNESISNWNNFNITGFPIVNGNSTLVQTINTFLKPGVYLFTGSFGAGYVTASATGYIAFEADWLTVLFGSPLSLAPTSYYVPAPNLSYLAGSSNFAGGTVPQLTAMSAIVGVTFANPSYHLTIKNLTNQQYVCALFGTFIKISSIR